MTKKLDNKGFTLVELLCTIVIVLLLTACITVGTGLATKTFDRTFNAVKAQTLAKTLNYLISDELRTAKPLSPAEYDEDGNLKYKSENYSGSVSMRIGKTGNKNLGRVYVETDDEADAYNTAGDVYVFGASSLYGKNLLVKNLRYTPDNNVFKVSYEIVDKSHPNTPLVKSSFEVKSLIDLGASPAAE